MPGFVSRKTKGNDGISPVFGVPQPWGNVHVRM
jgi:hypothetical protein